MPPLSAFGSFAAFAVFYRAFRFDQNLAAWNVVRVTSMADAFDSATALSVILHPQNPHAPSMHFHISWTEMKSGEGSWRMIADLNPAIPKGPDIKAFEVEPLSLI